MLISIGRELFEVLVVVVVARCSESTPEAGDSCSLAVSGSKCLFEILRSPRLQDLKRSFNETASSDIVC